MSITSEQKKGTASVNGRSSSLVSPPHPDDISQNLAYARWFLASTLLLTAISLAIWLGRQPMHDLWELLSDQDRVSAYLQSFGVWGPLVLAVIQFLQVMIVIIPGHVFLIAAGYVYGFPLGFMMNLIYVVVASQLAFLLSRWAGRPLVERIVPKDIINHWYKIGQKRGLIFFTIAFLLPVFPTDMMNFIAGLTGISTSHFFLANILGRLPGVIMLTLIGSHGLELSTTSWIVMGAIVASFYLLGRFVILKQYGE